MKSHNATKKKEGNARTQRVNDMRRSNRIAFCIFYSIWQTLCSVKDKTFSDADVVHCSNRYKHTQVWVQLKRCLSHFASFGSWTGCLSIDHNGSQCFSLILLIFHATTTIDVSNIKVNWKRKATIGIPFGISLNRIALHTSEIKVITIV